MSQAFDLVGDIHGYAKELECLLTELGYRRTNGVYRHSTRKVIFLGDFIDRGPQQRETINIVRPMIEGGDALAVMGNHEFNAIAYHTPDTIGGYLRKHSEKNRQQHSAFLDAWPDVAERRDVIAWFNTLPLWLDLRELRVVHACWDEQLMEKIKADYGGALITNDLLVKASDKNAWEYDAVETLLKGKEIPLPDGYSFKDKDGHQRRDIRIRWWDDVSSYREAFMGPSSAQTHIPDDPIAGDHLINYRHDNPPVFLGHYWLEPPIEPLAINIACLDYSVAKEGGHLVAYRWDGETTLLRDKFVSVRRS